MANGLLAKVALQANIQTNVYDISSSAQFATASLYVLNTNSALATVQVWATVGTTPGLADKIVHETQVPASGGELVMDCRLFSPNEKIFVQTDVDGCIVRLEGLEKI